MSNRYLALILALGIFFSIRLESRIYFVHIPKTGGTTLRLLLESQLSADEIYPYRNRLSAKGPVEHPLVSGHFPYWFCKQLDPAFTEAFKVTILREPVERYLSHLRAKKWQSGEFASLESVMKERLSPNSKFRADLMGNAQCRNLAADPNLKGAALLESAKQTLDTFDCVLFFDHFNQEVVDLFGRLGLILAEADIPKMNFTQKEPVSADLWNEVVQLNQLDIQLYEYAKKHLRKKETAAHLRTQSFEKVLKTTDSVDYTFDLPLNGRFWSYREVASEGGEKYPIHRWVTDQPASIYFSLEAGLDYRLYFNAQPLTSEVVPKVRVNGRDIALQKLNEDTFSLYYGEISKDWITTTPTEITLYSTQAFLYRDAHPSKQNRNYPLLSFAVNRIQISR